MCSHRGIDLPDLLCEIEDGDDQDQDISCDRIFRLDPFRFPGNHSNCRDGPTNEKTNVKSDIEEGFLFAEIIPFSCD